MEETLLYAGLAMFPMGRTLGTLSLALVACLMTVLSATDASAFSTNKAQAWHASDLRHETLFQLLLLRPGSFFTRSRGGASVE